MAPLISVVIPLFNKENSIKNTIESVLNQTFKDFELIIINDGSTDKSVEIISEFNDDRIQIITKENGGVSSARNLGVHEAKGDYVFFLDADDIIPKNCLFIFHDLTLKYKSEFVFVSNFTISQTDKENIEFCRGKKEQLIKTPLKALWKKKIFPRTGAMLINKDCFKYVGYFKSEISVYEDLDFIIRLIKKYKVVYTPEILLNYNCSFNQLSISNIDYVKEFAFYLNFKKKSFYECLIISEILYNSSKKRILYDKNDIIVKKAQKYFLRLLFMQIIRKIMT